MESPRQKTGENSAEQKDLVEKPESAAPENPESDAPKISREHDFTHTHPTHAKHKNFGMDHEPGAF